MSNFWGSIRNYGVGEGLSLYFNLKFGSGLDSISTSKLPHKVHFRPGTMDYLIFKQIFLQQDFNISILDEIAVNRILDLGANIGMASLYLKNKFPEANIVGVEPDESNVEMFRRNLEQYQNTDIVLGAIRGDNKKVEMVDYGKGETGYLAEESEEGIAALTIVDIMKKYQWNHIDILKIDIEGSEKSVFETNFESWLPKTKILFVELHERKAPGCTEVFNHAVSKYNFKRSKSGEYEVLVNLDLI